MHWTKFVVSRIFLTTQESANRGLEWISHIYLELWLGYCPRDFTTSYNTRDWELLRYGFTLTPALCAMIYSWQKPSHIKFSGRLPVWFELVPELATSWDSAELRFVSSQQYSAYFSQPISHCLLLNQSRWDHALYTFLDVWWVWWTGAYKRLIRTWRWMVSIGYNSNIWQVSFFESSCFWLVHQFWGEYTHEG